MATTKLLISIGAEGRSLAMYGDITDPVNPRYRVAIVEALLSSDKLEWVY